ncbi:hypothetical protein ROZALSC1DRAFT_23252 [Rozella allomycis CSF55]|uniref:Uncharacterized protein n=1 Tax=Rozella allomycis (strain CSF55) TaxID=988480 RepID=A0A4P9YG19_ROZAC|nr:hypothetical protein ROZALSC1DRAFT_23252 [Rozella allomycis CSF55]
MSVFDTLMIVLLCGKRIFTCLQKFYFVLVVMTYNEYREKVDASAIKRKKTGATSVRNNSLPVTKCINALMESATGKQKGFFHILRRHVQTSLRMVFSKLPQTHFLSPKLLRLVIDFIGNSYIVTDPVALMSEAKCQTQRTHTDYSMDRID